jgi:hypothetical protein
MLNRKRHSNASNNVTKWRTENLKDSSLKLNDEFTVRRVYVSAQKRLQKKLMTISTD